MKLVKSKKDLPTEPHFAVILYKSQSVYIPGDERSRTNPGHGYPERYETYNSCEHWVTTDRTVWENFVKLHHARNDNFSFFEVSKVGSLDIKISIK